VAQAGGDEREDGMTGTAVTVSRQELRTELARFEPSLAALLPPGVKAETVITAALVSAATNQDLYKCTPQSIALACARISQWGLVPGVTAHLVPFGATCTAVADYKGLIDLMVQSGARKVEARVVRQGDEFSYEFGLAPQLRHVPKWTSGRITHAYGIVTLARGEQQFEVMTIEEIDRIRQDKSKQWKKGDVPPWYARKTVIRQLAKYVPKASDRLAKVLAEDELEELPPAGPPLLAPPELPDAAALPAPSEDPGIDEPPADEPVTLEERLETVRDTSTLIDAGAVEVGKPKRALRTMSRRGIASIRTWAWQKAIEAEQEGSDPDRMLRLVASCDLVDADKAKQEAEEAALATPTKGDPSSEPAPVGAVPGDDLPF
jgi:recombination protein RecT